MTESFLNGRVVLHPGDCLDVLARLEEYSIDAVVTDPPYHLTSIVKRFGAENAAPAMSAAQRRFAKTGGGDRMPGTDQYGRLSTGFMGKQWDGGDIAFRPETWASVYRVMKPGAHLVACGGTRTYHRLTCAIEDAGFEIRDAVLWHYGSGFPKSLDVSKQLDKAAGAEREVVGEDRYAPRRPNGRGGNQVYGTDDRTEWSITAPATDAAREWQGWGTALKPSTEIICLARKPLSEPTVAANVLKWGTGALNIDGCRIGTEERFNPSAKRNEIYGQFQGKEESGRDTVGRWPANLCHDGSEEVLAAFPDAPGQQGDVRGTEPSKCHSGVYSGPRGRQAFGSRNDGGSAARFFYTAKADAGDRIGSRHPTVKPVDLMQWLVRLVTPKSVLCCPNCEVGSHESNSSEKSCAPEGVRTLRNNVSPKGQSAHGALLQPTMCGGIEGPEAETVRVVRGDLSAEERRGEEVLQQTLFEQGGSQEPQIDQGLCDDEARLQDASYAGPSSIARASGLHLRTSLGSGAADRSDANEGGGGAPHQRGQIGQSPRELTTNAQGRPRQAKPTASERPVLSPLSGQAHNEPSCPNCGRRLERRPGTILDPFSGTGTTGEAAFREGMRAVLIERDPEYQQDIRRRMALVMAGPDERERESIKAAGKLETHESLPLFGGAA